MEGNKGEYSGDGPTFQPSHEQLLMREVTIKVIISHFVYTDT